MLPFSHLSILNLVSAYGPLFLVTRINIAYVCCVICDAAIPQDVYGLYNKRAYFACSINICMNGAYFIEPHNLHILWTQDFTSELLIIH